MVTYEEHKEKVKEFLKIMDELEKFYTEELRWGKMLFDQPYPVILKKGGLE